MLVGKKQFSRFLLCLGILGFPQLALSQPQNLDLPPEILEDSPVLQRWQEQIPNLLEEIRHQPRFVTRFRFGYWQLPTDDDLGGLVIGVEDWWFGNSSWSLSADYQGTFHRDRSSFGVELNYFLLPLGTYVNLAPMLGYRYFQGQGFSTGGINLGARLLLAFSSPGAADLTLSQSFVLGGDGGEVGITNLCLGYAISRDLRLATELEQQKSPQFQDNRWAILLEWLGN